MSKKIIDVSLLVDRSGSMVDCAKESENGIDFFIKEQAKLKQIVTLSLLQFDTESEYIYKAVDIKDLKHASRYKLIPRGATALMDAIGKIVCDTKERIGQSVKKPDLVIIAIVTDGEENASREYTKERIKKLIQDREKEGWQFTYLGANQDAFSEAKSIGILTGVANYSVSNSEAGYSALSANVGRMVFSIETGLPISNEYTDNERKNLAADKYK